jgi:flagellar biosynthesis/type III secretory pathway protein FliH
VFQTEVSTLEETEREDIMQIVTSWMERGIEQGIAEGEQRGRAEGERSLVLRQLTRRLSTLPTSAAEQVQALDLPQLEALGEALLDFVQLSDLTDWLQSNP